MITTNHEYIFFFIVKTKSKNSTQIFQKRRTFIAIQSKDNFAVRLSLKVIFTSITFPNFLMVIYFAIHSKNLIAIFTEQWLFTGSNIHN